MTPGLFFLILYAITVIVCGVLHWAEHMDDVKSGYEKTLKEKVLYLYIIPLTPILNVLAIIYSVVDIVS